MKEKEVKKWLFLEIPILLVFGLINDGGLYGWMLESMPNLAKPVYLTFGITMMLAGIYVAIRLLMALGLFKRNPNV